LKSCGFEDEAKTRINQQSSSSSEGDPSSQSDEPNSQDLSVLQSGIDFRLKKLQQAILGMKADIATLSTRLNSALENNRDLEQKLLEKDMTI